MKISIKSYLDAERLAVVLLLFMPCLKWAVGGILGSVMLSVLVAALGVFLVFLNWKPVRMGNSYIWLLYIAAIWISLTQCSVDSKQSRTALFFTFTIMYVFFMDAKQENYLFGIKIIRYAAIVFAGLILIHFLLRERFNSLYWSFLKPDARYSAEKYFTQGYYYGVYYTPADVAGFLSILIASFIIQGYLCSRNFFSKKMNKNGKINYILAAAFLIPMLLTGKRGILIYSVLTVIIMYLLFFISKGQLKKALKFIIGAGVSLLLLILYIVANPDNPITRRFSEFIMQLQTGDDYDSGRFQLFIYAFEQWKAHPVLGIGWKEFSEYSMSVYHYNAPHEVNCDYLQFLCETGTVGFVLMIIPIITMLVKSIKVTKTAISLVDSGSAFMILLAVYIQIFISIYAFTEIPFYNTAYFPIYIFSCCIINSAYRRYGLSRITITK